MILLETGMNSGKSLSHFCKQLFQAGKKGEQRERTISTTNVSNAFTPSATKAASWVFAEGRQQPNTDQDKEGQNLVAKSKSELFML